MKLTLEGAQKVVAAVLDAARAKKKQISVSVADSGGHRSLSPARTRLR